MTALVPLATLAALTALLFAIYALRDWLKAHRNRPDDAPQDALDRSKDALGLTGLPDLVFLAASLFWIILALTLAFCLLAMIWSLPGLTIFEDAPDPQIIRATLLSIAALTTTAGATVALPITLRRAALQRRQTDTAELALFNEKINAATDDLHAMRQNTERDENGDFLQIIWEPDIVRRNAAIDALFGLSQERPEETGRIARMLSVYVRELSETEAKAETPPENADPDALREWAQNLEPQRSDMQAAVQILGRLRTEIRNPTLKDDDIDLSKANLQAMDLRRLCFDKAKLIGAQMQGANLVGAQLRWADLSEVKMQAADLREAQMLGARLAAALLQGANFGRSQMQGANLGGAQMQGADFGGAELQEAYLGQAEMQFGNFLHARLQGADLCEAQMQRAFFRLADMRGANLVGVQMQGADLTGTQMMGAYLGLANLQGADLEMAQMKGAYLAEAEFDEETNFTDAYLRFAALKSTTLAQTKLEPHQIYISFGDGGTPLRDDLVRPPFWPKEDLESDDFHELWHKWRAAQPGWDPAWSHDDP